MKKKDKDNKTWIHNEVSELFSDDKMHEKSIILDFVSNSQDEEIFDDEEDEEIFDDEEIEQSHMILDKINYLFSIVIESGFSSDILVDQFKELEKIQALFIVMVYLNYLEVFFVNIIAFNKYPLTPFKKFPFEKKKKLMNYCHNIVSQFVLDYYDYKRIMKNIEDHGHKYLSKFFMDFTEIAPIWKEKIHDAGLTIGEDD